MSKSRTPLSTGMSILLAGGLTSVILIGAIAGGNEPRGRKMVVPPVVPAAPVAPPPSFVSASGFTLTSASIELPDEASSFPDGPGTDVVNANCTSCHSASMALTQPRLTEAQWHSTVVKMRETYGAPIAVGDIDAIVDYLRAMPSQATPAGAAAGLAVNEGDGATG